MDEVVSKGFEVPPPRVSADVGVPAGVLQGSVVGPPLVRFMGFVETIAIPVNIGVNSMHRINIHENV